MVKEEPGDGSKSAAGAGASGSAASAAGKGGGGAAASEAAAGLPKDDPAFDQGLRRMRPGKIGKVGDGGAGVGNKNTECKVDQAYLCVEAVSAFLLHERRYEFRVRVRLVGCYKRARWKLGTTSVG